MGLKVRKIKRKKKIVLTTILLVVVINIGMRLTPEGALRLHGVWLGCFKQALTNNIKKADYMGANYSVNPAFIDIGTGNEMRHFYVEKNFLGLYVVEDIGEC
ncbi:hypothetical protein [Clostridium ganghwense]|uniref:Uncharacterized protein n=1 Tax=Clostridium ganghwense TaxID=312089 RepID=A0ABT4CTA5_9CLOT|nr:hypothetical protein [Clostridium ganghwense]MCY6372153.1 hypothetical protein [Clostridium ganghwense]